MFKVQKDAQRRGQKELSSQRKGSGKKTKIASTGRTLLTLTDSLCSRKPSLENSCRIGEMLVNHALDKGLLSTTQQRNLGEKEKKKAQ